MSSNTLQIGSGWPSGTATFVQNGQVDWIAFGNTIWSTSSAVLQRFASAGVQPVTFAAGLALASQFELDRVGNQRMHDALSNLHGSSGYGKVLYFGFGVRSFVQVMGDTQLGLNCIALCSSLAEIHGEDVSAWILEELWRLHNFPLVYLPSHAQFVALVKACAGVLAKTDFSSTADLMLDHALYGRNTLPEASNVEDVAGVIRGLFQISKGTICSISVTGEIECAFIAALAKWLFNFKVHVEDRAGTVLYQDASQEVAQVVVTYCAHDETALIQVSSTTFLLRHLDDLFNRNPTLDQILLTFRTPWDGCLTRIFGTAFRNLINLPYILGGFLGSVARVYNALALGESNVGKFSRKTYINFVEASYGQGFVYSAISIFPELRRSSELLEAMQRAAAASVDEALSKIEQTILNLAEACRCPHCYAGTEERAFCLLALAYSIRDMISTISCTVRDSDLLPTIRGIRIIHSEMSAQVSVARTATELPPLSVALGLEVEGMNFEHSQRYRRFDLLSNAIEIFSGHSDHARYYNKISDSLDRDICTARVRQGTCYYLDCLRSLSSQADMACLVHVLPGHIQRGDKQFSSIFDPAWTSNGDLTTIRYDTIEEHDSAAVVKEPQSAKIKIEAFGLENSDLAI
ncbi:MAG: hypothetical protein M1827_001004 [Pycnora praestabilis]|nr:MAG: hypothetical protein M1827_001004 [Pycnora praestabilis]